MRSRYFSKILLALVIIMFIVILFKLTSHSSDTAATNGWEQLTQEQLIQDLKTGKDEILVDLREPSLFKKGHIPNAINIPFNDFQTRYKELDRSKRIIFICHDGPMGDASCQFLKEKGYTNLANLQGGMSAWNGPVVE
jgi:rhodanese-related sulfurtransferase